MVEAFAFALIATGIVVLFVIGSRRTRRASPLKLKPTPPAPEEVPETDLAKAMETARIKAAEDAKIQWWLRPIGFVARLLTYAALGLALYVFAPQDISHTPFAALTLSDIISTFAFFAFAVVLVWALFNPSDDDDVRDAWGWLGVVILGAVALGLIYLLTR